MSPSRPPAILVVDHDVGVARVLAEVLAASGYQVHHAPTGAAARGLAAACRPDLIILDLVLPDEDGLMLCSLLKATAGVPILICSGTQRKRDAVLGFKLGADDFISKPFDPFDLVARVEVLLRRAQLPSPEPAGATHLGGLLIDHARRRVAVAGVPLRLTPTEFRLLSVLASRPQQVVPRDSLASLVWGDPDAETSRTIDVHVGRLRTKLARADRSAPLILAVRGAGYKLVAPLPLPTPAAV